MQAVLRDSLLRRPFCRQNLSKPHSHNNRKLTLQDERPSSRDAIGRARLPPSHQTRNMWEGEAPAEPFARVSVSFAQLLADGTRSVPATLMRPALPGGRGSCRAASTQKHAGASSPPPSGNELTRRAHP